MEANNQEQNTTNAERVVPQILAALASSANLSSAKILPSVFIPRPESIASWKAPKFATSADWALGWYNVHGFFGNRTRMNSFGYPDLLLDLQDNDIEDDYPHSLEEKLALLHALGAESLDLALHAVLEFDEFTFPEFQVVPGVPDILVWLHSPKFSCWFFSEVKAPGDSLRISQTEWLSQHWEFLRGHYLLTILE